MDIEKIDLKTRLVNEEFLNDFRDYFKGVKEVKERYDFTWNGKEGVKLEAAAPTTKTLHPDKAESVDFENTGNLFITGDNLDALKLLQESYLGKVDVIYIEIITSSLIQFNDYLFWRSRGVQNAPGRGGCIFQRGVCKWCNISMDCNKATLMEG
jgi:adenine specific DNA methylase Mod